MAATMFTGIYMSCVMIIYMEMMIDWLIDSYSVPAS